MTQKQYTLPNDKKKIRSEGIIKVTILLKIISDKLTVKFVATMNDIGGPKTNQQKNAIKISFINKIDNFCFLLRFLNLDVNCIL